MHPRMPAGAPGCPGRPRRLPECSPGAPAAPPAGFAMVAARRVVVARRYGLRRQVQATAPARSEPEPEAAALATIRHCVVGVRLVNAEEPNAHLHDIVRAAAVPEEPTAPPQHSPLHRSHAHALVPTVHRSVVVVVVVVEPVAVFLEPATAPARPARTASAAP